MKLKSLFSVFLRILAAVVVLVAAVATGVWGSRNLNLFAEQPPTPTLQASALAMAPSPTSSRAADTLPQTNTPLPEITFTPSPGPSPTPSNTPTSSATPTVTPTPSLTPTSLPQIVRDLATLDPTRFGNDESVPTPATAIPTPVPTFEVSPRTTNVLLLGSDTSLSDGAGRTDTMIIVSINRDGPTASMVSLPRDLYVYIPGWTMNRLNTALSRGSSIGYPGGAVAQLEDTILYNFGVPIHFYAQIDFSGFQQGVDLVGGVQVAVSCELTDWRLKSPELDPADEDNWEKFTLEPGIHHMDGDLALWYARSRRSTNDFDRGRRQQQLLRSMLNHGVDVGLMPQLPELWNTYQDAVRTDVDIGRLLQLATLAPAVRANGVQHLYIVGNQVNSWIVPESNAQVLLPVWENMEETFRRLFLPPALNRATRPPIVVEVVNGTGNPDLAPLAADNLAWYGFEPVISPADRQDLQETTIQYYAQNFKGSFNWLLSWIFEKGTGDIELVPDTPYFASYRVVLGADYDPCRPQLFAPQIFLEQ